LAVTINLKTKLKNWKYKIWNQIKEAKQAQYELDHLKLEKELQGLLEELGITDPLSLRKIEREEVMKGVMRWIFGPSFQFSPTGPSGIDKDLYDADDNSIRNPKTWENVTLHGDVIKFLHQAIEWENMLYFLYPYFWSHPTRWELKKYMQHQDIMHKIFLKSGAARVVLTIRPGFEQDFVSFVESGGIMLPNQPKTYLPITREMENYAKTNYPGIPTANPNSDARPLLLPIQRKAWKEMQNIIKLLDAYFQEKGYYPSTKDGGPDHLTISVFEALKPYLSKISTPEGEMPLKDVPKDDPWGKDYEYTCPGIYGEYDLICYGAEGKSGKDKGGPAIKQGGTPNENAFITNWAESSLIGSWFEYTPTSALDITFNEKLPNE